MPGYGQPKMPDDVRPARPSRAEVVATRLVVLGALAFLGSPLAVLALFGPRASLAIELGVPIAILGLMLAVSELGRRTGAREVREAGGRLCLGCRQSLRGLTETGVCPECGKAYEIDEVRRSWRWRYASSRRLSDE